MSFRRQERVALIGHGSLAPTGQAEQSALRKSGGGFSFGGGDYGFGGAAIRVYSGEGGKGLWLGKSRSGPHVFWASPVAPTNPTD